MADEGMADEGMADEGMANAAFIQATPGRHSDCANRRTMVRIASSSVGMAVSVVLGMFQLGIAFAQTSPGQSPVQSSVPTVTSDSPAYCDVLIDRISTMARAAAMPPPTEAATLSEAGEWMCVHGQTRGGILRLRRALAIMMHGDD
jgi:hypothetical protein